MPRPWERLIEKRVTQILDSPPHKVVLRKDPQALKEYLDFLEALACPSDLF